MTNQFNHKSSSNLLAYVFFWEEISDVGLYIVGLNTVSKPSNSLVNGLVIP